MDYRRHFVTTTTKPASVILCLLVLWIFGGAGKVHGLEHARQAPFLELHSLRPDFNLVIVCDIFGSFSVFLFPWESLCFLLFLPLKWW